MQNILKDFVPEVQLYQKGISGFDVIAEKNDFFPFESLMDIEGLDSPFKYPLFNNSDRDNDEKMVELVAEAIYGCHPIRMEYRDANFDITFRNITLVSYISDSKDHFCDKMWSNYYNSSKSKIVAYCELRDAQRQFYVSRIRTIQVFNLKHFGIGHLLSFSAALWYPLEKNDFELAEHIANLIPASLKETDIQLAGNLAHYLLLNGQKEEAIEIYKKHDGKQLNDEYSWRELNLKDFEDLKDIADYGVRFEEAKELLSWK